MSFTPRLGGTPVGPRRRNTRSCRRKGHTSLEVFRSNREAPHLNVDVGSLHEAGKRVWDDRCTRRVKRILAGKVQGAGFGVE